jgi:hypothetical protein
MPGTLPNHAMSCKLRILTVNSSAEYGVGNERWVPVDRTPTRPLPLELRFGLHATIWKGFRQRWHPEILTSAAQLMPSSASAAWCVHT